MSKQEDFDRPEKPLEKTREIDSEARISKKAKMKRKFNRNQKRITLWDIQLSSLTSLVWPNVTDDSDTATHYYLQLAALITVFNRYKDIDVMRCYTEDDVLSSSLAVLRYAHRYFNTSNIKPIEFWSKILSLADEHILWKPLHW